MRIFLVLMFFSALRPCTGFAQQLPAGEHKPSVAAPSTTTPQKTNVDITDPLMDLPPLPKEDVSLVGGNVSSIDRVRNALTVRVFGGKKMKFVFDERTHIYRDGVETTQLGIHKGDRVYVDTQLVGTKVFARNIRVGTASGPAYAQGQIQSFDLAAGTLLLKDSLSDEPVSFYVTQNTLVQGKISSLSGLRQGTLAEIKFVPDPKNNRVAKEIIVTALPGEMYTFVGHVTFLDISSGVLAVQNQTDNKTYDIQFDPTHGAYETLGVGANVNISARFDGNDYIAREITVTQAKE